MKTWLIAALMVGLSGAMVATDADARRLGGGKPAGMQRATPDKAAQQPPAATPNNPAAPTNAAAPATGGAAAAAAAPKRSWMGPIAGLAAGLGIAALMSHLGMGEAFGNILMMVLLAGLAFVAIRFLMKRFARNGNTPAMATPNGMRFQPDERPATPTGAPAWAQPASGGSSAAPVVAAAAASALPAGFDAAGFERIAKMIFIRMQAANDTGDLNDLR